MLLPPLHVKKKSSNVLGSSNGVKERGCSAAAAAAYHGFARRPLGTSLLRTSLVDDHAVVAGQDCLNGGVFLLRDHLGRRRGGDVGVLIPPKTTDALRVFDVFRQTDDVAGVAAGRVLH